MATTDTFQPFSATKVDIASLAAKIDFQTHFLSLGSCFADNISRRMSDAQMAVCANPFGTTYNPQTIARQLRLLISDDQDEVIRNIHDGLFEHEGLWHSFLFHGSFSDTDKERMMQRIRESLSHAAVAAREADVLIITFGTAFVYYHGGEVVSNCHKLPSRLFERKMLTVSEIVDEYESLLALPQMRDKTIIFTVSPIRHLKDGLHQNQLSKATLLLATAELCRRYPAVHYFPSYEIMMDELRDYRFYADDMLHPSDKAVEYIWQRFQQFALTDSCRKQIADIMALRSQLNHRLLHPNTPAARQFMRQVERHQQDIEQKYGIRVTL